MNTIKKIQIFILFILLIGIAFYIYKDFDKKAGTQDSVGGNEKEATIEEQIRSAIEADGEFSVDIIPVEEFNNETSIPIPDLNGEIVISQKIPLDAQDILKEKISTLRSELKTDNIQYDKWINLGLQYKIAEDYESAKEVWEYVNLVWPKNSISFHNLGDLYGYYLKNPQKSEENFKKAIDNSPNNIMYYFKLAEFYRDVVKDNDKAVQVAQKGVSKNPNSQELAQLLESLQDQ